MSTEKSASLPRIIILSDLWGFVNCDWIDTYEKALKDKFSITRYDCRKLGQIDLESSSQELIHSQFLGGGIDKAVANLVELEQNEVHVLAFSVGGTIAWQAVKFGLKAVSLTAVSATRLRHETESVYCDLSLYFGEKDQYAPKQVWADKLDVKLQIIKGYGHEAYAVPKVAQRISAEIKDRLMS